MCCLQTDKQTDRHSQTDRQTGHVTVLVALVLLSLGKPLMVIGSLDPVAVEEQQRCRQDHQEGKQQPHHQPNLTCGDTHAHTERGYMYTIIHAIHHCIVDVMFTWIMG